MFKFFSNFKQALKLLFGDKIILALSFVPIILGIGVYSILGSWLYGDLLDSGRRWIETSFTGGFFGEVFFYILAGLMTVGLYFVINWTFVLIVSLIACPFNDWISSRVEQIVLGKTIESGEYGFKRMIVRIWSVVMNEIKKITFILTLTLVSLGFSIFGFVPISFIISAILMAVAFVDYCWSRHNMNFSSCVANYRESLFSYTFSGAIFLLLMSIPILNLLMLPYAVVFFSYLFSSKRV